MKTNFLTWISLLVLCAVSFLARGGTGILWAASLKCSIVSWHFMELRRAHWFWRVALLGLVGSLLATLSRF